MFLRFVHKTHQHTPALILVLSVLMGVVWQYFFFDKALGISFPLFIILIVLGFYGVIVNKTEQKGALASWLIIPLLFFSWMVFVRDNTALTVFNVLISLYALSLLLYSMTSTRSLIKQIEKALSRALLVPFYSVMEFFRLFKKLPYSNLPISGNKKLLLAIGRGALITIPIFVIFTVLFVSADAGFGDFIKSIVTFNISIDVKLMWRVMLSIIIAGLIGGAYAYSFYHTDTVAEKKEVLSTGQNRWIEIAVLLISLNILFFAFIIVQSTYLFGGVEMVSKLGLTYAEYARRGFFELVVVSILTFIIVMACDYFQNKRRHVHGYTFKIASSLIIVQTLLIMTSAFYRLSLYESAFGFTLSRFFAHTIIIWLGVMLVFLGYKILARLSSTRFLQGSIISVLVVFGILNILNPERFIVGENIKRFNATGKIDEAYLTQLSDDSVPAVIVALKANPPVNLGSPLSFLDNHINNRKIDGPTDERSNAWQSLRIAHINAQRALDSYGH